MVFSVSGGFSLMTAYAATATGYTELASALEAGGQYIVTNADGTKAMSASASGDGLAGKAITMNDAKTEVSTADTEGLEALIWTSDDGKLLSLDGKKLRITTTVSASESYSSQVKVTEANGIQCTENSYYLYYGSSSGVFATDYGSSNVKVYKISTCAHTNRSNAQHKDATCTEAGYDRFHCDDCGKDIETVIPAEGHVPDGAGTEYDTYWQYTCSKCSQVYQVMKDERFGAMKLNGVTASFDDSGSSYPWKYSANNEKVGANAIVSSNQGIGSSHSILSITFSSEKEYTLSFNYATNGEGGYDYLTVTVDGTVISTKTASGAEYFNKFEKKLENLTGDHTIQVDFVKDSFGDKGTDSGYIYNIAAEVVCEHEWTTTEAEIPATCTEDGKTAAEKCSKCQSVRGGDVIAALGHDYQLTSTTSEPTCGAAGTGIYTCQREGCGDTKTDLIPATGNHNFSDGVCIVCGAPDQWDGVTKTEPRVNEDGAYVLTDGAELAWFADKTNEAQGTYNAVVTKDINMGAHDWSPMGYGTTPSATVGYAGTFDGGGHTITIDMSEMSAVPGRSGLFDHVCAEGTVTNVVVAGNIKGTNYSGGIASTSFGIIENCVNEANVSGCASAYSMMYLGGIVGYNGSSITGCANRGTVDAASENGLVYAGGIAGYTTTDGKAASPNRPDVKNCYNTGEVKAATGGAGNCAAAGITGYLATNSSAQTTVENCYSAGALTSEATKNFTGGIAGVGAGNSSYYKNVTLKNCWYLTGTADTAVTSSSTYDCCVQENCGAKTQAELKSPDFIAADSGSIAGYKADDSVNPINGGYPVLEWETAGTGGDAPTEYTVTFNSNGGTEIAPQTVAEGGRAQEPEAVPVKDGFVFIGWFTDDECTQKFDFDTEITGDITLYAGYEADDPQETEPPMDAAKTYYIISTPAQLTWYAQQTETAGYAVGAILDADIDMSGCDWNPMGGNSTANGYKGMFDGMGHTITIDMSSMTSLPDKSGLFDYVAAGGIVKNVILAGTIKGGTYTGGIASHNYGTIERCINRAEIDAATSTSSVFAGGIAGQNYASIKNCGNTGAITAIANGLTTNIYAGGIAGRLDINPNTDPEKTCRVEKCYNTGKITAETSGGAYSKTYAGGIAGYWGTISQGTIGISNCYSAGEFDTSRIGSSNGYKFCGGIVGAGYAVSQTGSTKDNYKNITLNQCWYLDTTASYAVNCAASNGDKNDDPDYLCCVQENCGSKTSGELKGINFLTEIDGYKSDGKTNPINGGYPVLEWQTVENGTDPEPQPSDVWDGTLDFSWYNENDVKTEYHITTPAQWEAIAWICSEHLGELQTNRENLTAYTDGNIANIIGDIPTKQNTFTGVSFYLDNDIDMGGVYDEAAGTWSGKNYYPIGSQGANDSGTGNFYGEFCGSFYGQGHTVKNVYCDRGDGKSYQAVGLFGRVGERDKESGDTSPYDQVKNDIVIENVAVTGYFKSGRSVGGVVGKTLHVSEGHTIIVRNCVNYADVNSTDTKGVGGIVGALWNNAKIENCINFGNVTCGSALACAGGIAGSNDGKNYVYNSINFGTIDYSGSDTKTALGTIIGNDDSKREHAVNCYYLAGSVVDQAVGGDTGNLRTGILYYGEEVSEAAAKSSALAEKLGSAYKPDCGGYPALYWQKTTEHQYGAAVDVPANCTTAAHKESICTVCGDVKVSDIQQGTALGDHSWENGVCTVCGEKLEAAAEVTPASVDLNGTDGTITLKLKTTTAAKLAGAEFTLDLPEGFTVEENGITSSGMTNITYDKETGKVLCYAADGVNVSIDDVIAEVKIAVSASVSEGQYNAAFKDIVFAVYDKDSNLSKKAMSQESASAELTVTVSEAPPIVTYDVTFESNGGSSVEKQTVNEGEKIVKPADPTRANYDFTGWYTDVDCTNAFNFDTPVTGNTILYAGWKVKDSGTGGSGSGGSGGGSGGSGTTTADQAKDRIIVNTDEKGTVSVTPEKVKTGDTITITVKPAGGYLIDGVKVTDEKKNAVTVKDNGDGTYTFTLPSGKVTVDVTYKADPSAQNPASGRFIDVVDSAWYHDAVYYAADNGYFKGTSDTLFSPDVTMTRAMFATVIGRMAGVDESKYSGSAFSDVPEGQWYSAYIKWASENDIVNGVGGGKFEPDTKITREQMAAMMYRYAKFAGVDLTSAAATDATAFNAFADRDSVSAYAKDAMIWATAKGIINGNGTGLAPKSDATRAQVAQIIMNYVKQTAK